MFDDLQGTSAPNNACCTHYKTIAGDMADVLRRLQSNGRVPELTLDAVLERYELTREVAS